MTSNAEEFRKCADECYRLSVRLKNEEHKAFAVYLAGAWLALAEHAERKQAARNHTVSSLTTPDADPQSTDPAQPED